MDTDNFSEAGCDPQPPCFDVSDVVYFQYLVFVHVIGNWKWKVEERISFLRVLQ